VKEYMAGAENVVVRCHQLECARSAGIFSLRPLRKSLTKLATVHIRT